MLHSKERVKIFLFHIETGGNVLFNTVEHLYTSVYAHCKSLHNRNIEAQLAGQGLLN